jgi:hypothetical protein
VSSPSVLTRTRTARSILQSSRECGPLCRDRRGGAGLIVGCFVRRWGMPNGLSLQNGLGKVSGGCDMGAFQCARYTAPCCVFTAWGFHDGVRRQPVTAQYLRHDWAQPPGRLLPCAVQEPRTAVLDHARRNFRPRRERQPVASIGGPRRLEQQPAGRAARTSSTRRTSIAGRTG